MNYWHNYDKHNENVLSDCDQLTHQFRSTFSYSYYLHEQFSITHFAYIFYLWKCCCNLCVYYT